MQLLQTLTEGTGELSETRARKFFDNLEIALDRVDAIANGTPGGGKTLANMLKDGGFPETESKAFRDAVAKAIAEFEDLKMGVLMPFEMARNDAEDR
jgi:hypothetical protein